MLLEFERKIRISGPVLSPEEAIETRRAIDKAKDALPAAQLPALIWWLFVEAMDTHRRMPGNGFGPGLSRWPHVLHTYQERWEAELARLADVKISKEEPPLPRFAITDRTAIDRMLTVLGWLKYVKGKNFDRDTVVFLQLAEGKPPRIVRKNFHYSCCDSTMRMIKQRYLQHISEAIGRYAKG